MAVHVALLRGVNVGGARKLPMLKLAGMLTELGLDRVVTYIQSGNAVFEAPPGDRAALATRIERELERAFALEVTVLLRTRAELARIAKANPFLDANADVSKLHVLFLAAKPTGAALARLDPERSPPDEFSVKGSEVYLRYPNGSGRSKLTGDHFERTLGLSATARNWRTVTKLLELAER